jgi:hypothetical protein
MRNNFSVNADCPPEEGGGVVTGSVTTWWNKGEAVVRGYPRNDTCQVCTTENNVLATTHCTFTYWAHLKADLPAGWRPPSVRCPQARRPVACTHPYQTVHPKTYETGHWHAQQASPDEPDGGSVQGEEMQRYWPPTTKVWHGLQRSAPATLVQQKRSVSENTEFISSMFQVLN